MVPVPLMTAGGCACRVEEGAWKGPSGSSDARERTAVCRRSRSAHGVDVAAVGGWMIRPQQQAVTG